MGGIPGGGGGVPVLIPERVIGRERPCSEK